MFCCREAGFFVACCRKTAVFHGRCLHSLRVQLPQTSGKIVARREKVFSLFFGNQPSAPESCLSLKLSPTVRSHGRGKSCYNFAPTRQTFTCLAVHISAISVEEQSRQREQEIAVQSPLCEKVPQFEVSVKDLLNWRHAARLRAANVGKQLADGDGGPDSQELLREVEWMLDDSIAGLPSDRTETGVSADVVGGVHRHANWIPHSWKQLFAESNRHSGSRNEDSSWLRQKVIMRAGLEDLENMLECRIEQRVPFQYLVGASHWRDMVIAVQPGVLIPRPETEMLIDMVEAAVSQAPHLAKGMWADMGTGSGAIAIALARLLPDAAEVVAVDKSPVAIAVASANARRLGVAKRVRVLHSDWFSALDCSTKLAGIVSNPPYIPSRDLPTLQAEVGRHEPWLALDGGSGDGMHSIRTLCQGAAKHLQPGGFLAIETNGGGQAELTARLLSEMHVVEARKGESISNSQSHVLANGSRSYEGGSVEDRPKCFENVKVLNDLNMISRFVTATRCRR